jgi:hypothetical protein
MKVILHQSGAEPGEGLGGLSSPDINRKKIAKRLQIFIFIFATTFLIFLGRVTHHLKGVFKTFPTVYYMPPNSKFFNW